MDLTEKILFYMKRYHMIPENKNIVVGLSGGADSVCLLYVLAALRKKLGLQLCAVHVHHGLRGVEADADEAYVRDICRAWDVPLKAMRIDAAALAKQWGIGCEEAGRRARYEIFEECLQGMGGCRGAIAVAHHRDDCAETLLFHMFRGTGLDGMAGIRPVRKTERESMIIRPLLETGKTEIESFLQEKGISWRIDSTNTGEDYTRNRIRNRVLPYAEKEICSGAGAHLAKEAQLLAETADFVRSCTRQALERCRVEADDLKANACGIEVVEHVGRRERTAEHRKNDKRAVIYLNIELLQQEDMFLQKQCVRECLLEIGTGRDLTAAHIEAVRHLVGTDCQSGRKLRIPACQLEVERQFGLLVFRRLERQQDASPEQQGVSPEQQDASPEQQDALPEQQDASLEQQFDRGRQVGLQTPELPLPEHSSELHVPGMGVVSVRYLQRDELTAGEKKAAAGEKNAAAGGKNTAAGEKNAAAGEKNTAAGEESSAAAGAFLKNIPQKKYTKWLDYDKIIQSVVFRTRRSGDYLTIDDNFSKKSLKKYMIEEKIPANERNSMLVLADGNHIIWVPGGRISTYYRVTEQTKVILEVTCMEKQE